MDRKRIKKRIFELQNEEEFQALAIELFHITRKECAIYSHYLSLINFRPEMVKSIHDIPGLPISAFKNHEVKTGYWESETVFTSSGTSGKSSKHHVKELSWYTENARHCFSQFYGNPDEYTVFALLPSYLERTGSSLINMAADFIRLSQDQNSGFYLDATEKLIQNLEKRRRLSNPILLLGVSFALLDMAERNSIDLSHCIVMETGGMKGRKEEMSKPAFFNYLKEQFNLSSVHGEYGMTELLSQAYAKSDGLYRTPQQMKVLLKDLHDPYSASEPGKSGIVQIIDLANFDSCPFILTEDVGFSRGKNTFEILGRLAGADLRGCNLLLFE